MATRAVTKRRKKRKKSPALRGTIVVLAAVVVLAIAYCVLCAVAGSGDVLRAGTSVNGVDIGGLTRDEAVSALSEALEGVTAVDGVEYATIQVIPDMEDADTYTVDLSAALGYDVESAVDEAMDYDRGGSFLSRGIRFLSTMGGGRSYQILPYAYDEEAVTAAVDASGLMELDTTVQTTYTMTETTLELTMGTSGVTVDEEALVAQIIEATANGDYSDINCATLVGAPDAVDLQAIRDEIYTEASDATLDVAEDNSYTIVESVRGIDLDVDAAQTILDAAAEGETVSVPLEREDPAIDTATLEAVLFRDVLGEYTTSVSGTSARRSNVKLAGEKCNGTILLPGETFSYNDVVGQRTAEAGFQAAAAYLNGETVQELGGGVCQGSSTLYCACLYANLEIVSRTNHTYVSSYVPLGMDATVSWGGPDFQFRNNTDYPIQVVCSYANDRITFQILGTDVNDYTVKITTSTLEVISPTVTEVEDNTLEVGTTVTESSGHTGYKVQSYRQVYDADGTLISETAEAYSYYKMTAKVVRVGTKVVETEETTTEEPDTGSEDAGTTDTDTGTDTGSDTTDTGG